MVKIVKKKSPISPNKKETSSSSDNKKSRLAARPENAPIGAGAFSQNLPAAADLRDDKKEISKKIKQNKTTNSSKSDGLSGENGKSKNLKIRIIGGPGSGKTYLGKKLSDYYKISHTDLDDLQWSQNNYDIMRDEKNRDLDIKKILKKKSWIIEGAYVRDWTQKINEEAEIIILLQPNRIKRSITIIRRFCSRKLGFQKSKKESLKNLYHLLKWNWNYDNRTADKLVKFNNNILKRIKKYNSADKAFDEMVTNGKIC